jgi:hypothetical protein
MPISYDSAKTKLHTLLRRLRTGRLSIPEHQRDFVWSLRQQVKLVDAILRGKPIPSVLLRDLEDADDTTTLEDGRQRLETLAKYINNEFPVDGLCFRDRSPEVQQAILNYDVIVVSYSGADDEQSREIFNDFQNGKPLTFGERLIASSSPIVDYSIRKLMTAGEGFHDRLAASLGVRSSPKARRGADMAQAFSLCAGLAFGIDHLSRKWDDAAVILSRGFDNAAVDAKLELYTRIWERVNELAPVTTKARRNDYWNLGTFGGYIVYSFELCGTEDAARYGLPPTRADLVEVWAQHIAAAYRDETLLSRILHRDLSAARSWKLARWANGLARMFEAGDMVVMVDSDDEDDASD